MTTAPATNKTVVVEVYPNRVKTIRKDKIIAVYPQPNFITEKTDTFFCVEDYDGSVKGYITYLSPIDFINLIKEVENEETTKDR